MLFAVWMDLEIIILSEVSQIEKDKCTIDIVFYDVWNLKKNDTNKLICKTDIGSQKANYDYQME